jgi:hypothetical protein
MVVLVKTLVPLRVRGFPWSWKHPWYPLGGVYEGVAAAEEVEVVVVVGATLEVEVVDAEELVEDEDEDDEEEDVEDEVAEEDEATEDDELELVLELLAMEAGADKAENRVIL